MISMKKKITTGIGIVLLALGIASCGSKPQKQTIEKENVNLVSSSDSIYVKKVNNLDDEFILGMDASSVISLEDSGVKYYNYDGEEQDVFKTLAENGVNYIRVRVWNNPYDKNGHGYGGGNNDIDKAVEIGKRATKYGMKLMVDFHYSDFWADPAKQQAPKAWEGKSVSKKASLLYNYTVKSLQKLYYAGVDVGMVQIGNETNNGIAGETTLQDDGNDWKNVTTLMKSGSKAVRKVFPDALVAVHFANPEKSSTYKAYAWNLNHYNVDYDVFASSYYPYWHGTLDNLSEILSYIANTYNKKVMVAETSYANEIKDTDFWGNTIGTSGYDYKPYPFTLSGQVNHVVDVVDTIKNKTTNGIGVCYWEGTWIGVGTTSYEANNQLWEKYGSGWASSYSADYDPEDAGKWHGGCAVENQAFFDEDGKPFETLKVFALMKEGNIIERYVDGAEDVEVTYLETDDIVLPETVNVIYCDNSTEEAPVTWNFTESQAQAAKTGGNKKYTIEGRALGKTCYCYLNILEVNLLENYSFENGKTITPWVANITGGGNTDTYKVGVTQENPQTGKYVYHFWAKNANTVKFFVEQELTGLETGNYKMQASILGGADGTTNNSLQNIYMYVKINGEVAFKKDMKFKSYSEGYQTYLMNDIEYTEGDTIVVGFYVEANQEGSWGGIDDIMFNHQR